MRKWYEFMIWNHIFIFVEVIYACILCEYILFLLGFITVVFSTLRHLYSEQKYNIIEPIIAKLSICYNLIMSIYYFTFYQNIILLFIKCVLVVTWSLESYNYEYIHPWLHIIVSIDAHIYLIFYRNLFN